MNGCDGRGNLAGSQADCSSLATLRQAFYTQIRYCQFEIIPGPEKKVKWGVPDGTHAAETGELVHDDLLLSAALVAVLDGRDWSASAPAQVIQGIDPLREMDRKKNE